MMDEQAPEFVFLGRYAGFVTRMVAFIIDRAILSIIVFVTVWFTEWIMNAFQINVLLFSEGSSWQLSLALTAGLYALVLSLIHI